MQSSKIIKNGYQPESIVWPDKDAIDLPVVKPILLINLKHSLFKRIYTFLTQRPRFIVKEDYFCYVKTIGAYIWIPANFVYDFASVPKFIPFIHPVGILAYPALPHDCMYRFGCLLLSEGPGHSFVPVNFSRRRADKIFLDLAKETNGLNVICSASTAFIRLFGGMNYSPRDILIEDWNNLVY